MDKGGHKGWHSRGYLPHLDAGQELQSITFRLSDALPAHVVEGWKAELLEENDSTHEKKLREKISRYEDAGYGECLLRFPECARTVQQTLLHFDAEKYRLLEWCIMPNHAHVLIKVLSDHRTGDLVKSWKTFSARQINGILNRQGPVWAVDYHDRYIRDEVHLANVRSYIRRNPVAAGLCKEPEQWRWSSAWKDE